METQRQNILVRGCIGNNRSAQKELYEAYRGPMFSLCMRVTGNYEDARDALQDGFISVFRDIAKFRAEASLGSWIKTIMLRSALKRIRRMNFMGEENIPDTTVDFDAEFTGEELHRAIMELSDGYRAVFMMYEVEGYSHREIADMLGISEGTSKSQLFYAKRKLKETLKNYR